MQIDPRRHLPIYLQIAEAIRGGVAAGTYRPGEALPSLRELAVPLRSSPSGPRGTPVPAPSRRSVLPSSGASASA